MAQTSRPFSRPFSFRIKHAQYHEHPTAPTPADGADPPWIPSNLGRFTIERSSGWWIWDPGEVQSQDQLHRLRRPTEPEIQGYRPYRQCTIIWDPERHGYIQVPIDCTATELSATPYAWRRLSFGYHDTPDRAHIALIGHQRDRSRLHLPGPDHWFEQLLPDVCKAQADSPRRCQLAGHLSLLVGLVAFSSRPEYDRWAVDRSFRHDVRSTLFRPNTLPKSPKNQKRTVIVEIGHDPDQVTLEELRAWENGDHGEIFS